MPTPFYHLSLAQELIERPDLPPSFQEEVVSYRAEFLFGNIAPDVQVVSGQPRAETHFFDLPLRQNLLKPWELLWQTYPQLTLSSNLKPQQRAFLIGYLCHLLADWQWIRQIFIPVFGLQSPWGTFQERLIWHNVLRAYLDQQIIPAMKPNLAEYLLTVTPQSWLPFVADHHLLLWRDQIARQLQPGQKIETIEIFASRQNISPDEFKRYLSSEDAMEEIIFQRLPRTQLNLFRSQLIEDTLSFIKQLTNTERIN
jgi:hypothetical protein